MSWRTRSIRVVRTSRLRDLVRQAAADCESFDYRHTRAGREVASNGRRQTLRSVCSDSGESEERLDVFVCDGWRTQCRCVPVEPTTGVECHER